MCSSSINGITSSTARFPLHPTTRPDPFPISSIRPHRPKPRISLISGTGSVKPISATINDGAVVSFAETMSFYELLGIPETGTLLEIKQAYKQLARKYHPDVSPPDRVEEYTQKFIMVQEAYQTLSDPGRRALYDDDMSKGLHFAFSARKRYQNDEMEDRREWKTRWHAQLSELKRRSMYKEARGSMSWAERVRMQRNESSSE